MNITNINLYAEGYYSDSTHEENITIRTETYKKLKEEIDNIKCYISELDGKHSEVKAEITTENYTEDEIKDTNWDCTNDGDVLSWDLESIFNKHNLSLKDEIKIVEDYINSLNTYIDITIRIRKSNKEKVLAFCVNL
jgi:SMC interacting uncharacterized protein involved in chromosome segregation